MKLLNTIFSRLGFMPKRQFRAYAAAANNRLLNDWVSGNKSGAEEVKSGLKSVRERSRQLERDNDYTRQFLSMVVKNVVGSTGIILQVKAKDRSGSLDLKANAEIEDAWSDWGKIKNCSVDGKKSWLDVQKLAIRSMARDGEVIIRMIRGFDNPYNFSLQVIEGDHLDEQLNSNPSNLSREANKVKMGVEYNEWSRPVAYWLLSSHPGDYISYRCKKYTRVPANEIIHLYIEERENQGRGMGWMHTVMKRLHHLDGYEEAELIGARVDSCKGGFYQPTENYEGDGQNDMGNVIQEVSPGFMEQLPKGMEFKEFNPSHPSGIFQFFVKTTLRGIAAGLDVSYNRLSKDLESVNYSSLRSGELDERDAWMTYQQYLIEHLCSVVYEAWLDMYLMSGIGSLPYSKMAKFQADTWQPRRWTWVDPESDTKAQERAVVNGWKSNTQVAAEYGNDYEDVAKDREREKKVDTRTVPPLGPLALKAKE